MVPPQLQGGRGAVALSTRTSTDLLDALRDPQQRDPWTAYVERYQPILVATLLRMGTPASEAEDVAQEALVEFAAAYREGKYRRDAGRLRSWLFGILRNHWRAWHRRRVRRRTGAEYDAALDALAESDPFETTWQEEWRSAVLRQTLRQVEAEVSSATYRAFDLFVLQELGAAETARRLGTTEEQVYSAKRRVLARVRELRTFVDDVY